MRKISLCILMILFSFAGYAQTNKKKKPDPVKEGFIKATVIKYEVESWGFILVLDGKTKKDPKIQLQPEGGLDEKFRKDKLKVWLKYAVMKKQPMTTCMAGQVVKIEEIKIRK